jgi:hypothetical protein
VAEATPLPGRATNTRCCEFEQIGAGAYARLFDMTPTAVTERLRSGINDTMALSYPFLKLLAANAVDYGFGPRPAHSSLSVAEKESLVGARGYGYEVVRQDDGRVGLTPRALCDIMDA